jgi:hypothetical protein
MFSVTSIHGADVDPQHLSAVMSDYMALEQARIYRRLFSTRFGVLAIVFAIVGLGLHWMPATAAWGSVGICLAVAAYAWVAELRCDWKLSKTLEAIPGTAQPPSTA